MTIDVSDENQPLMELPPDTGENGGGRYDASEHLLDEARKAKRGARKYTLRAHKLRTRSVVLHLKARRATFAARALSEDAQTYRDNMRTAKQKLEDFEAEESDAKEALDLNARKFAKLTRKYKSVLAVTNHLTRLRAKTNSVARAMRAQGKLHADQARAFAIKAFKAKEMAEVALDAASVGESTITKAEVAMTLAKRHMRRARSKKGKARFMADLEEAKAELLKGQRLLDNKDVLETKGRQLRRQARKYSRKARMLAKRSDQELATSRSGSIAGSIAGQQRDRGTSTLRRVARRWQALRRKVRALADTHRRLKQKVTVGRFELRRWRAKAHTTTTMASAKRAIAARLMSKVRKMEAEVIVDQEKADRLHMMKNRALRASNMATARALSGE